MPKRTTSYRARLLKSLADPLEAVHYINAAIDDSPEMFLKALRNVAQAQNREMANIAKDAGIARESLYRALSSGGNPRLDTLHSVLGVLGMDIQVAPKEGTRGRITLPTAPRLKGQHQPVSLEIAEPKVNVVNSAIPGQFGTGELEAFTDLIAYIEDGVPSTSNGWQRFANGNVSIFHCGEIGQSKSIPLAPIECVVANQQAAKGPVKKYG